MESAWNFFFSSRRRHTRCLSDWSSDVCSSDLSPPYARPASTTNGLPRYTAGGRVVEVRSEERRVGKECRSGWWTYHLKKRDDPHRDRHKRDGLRRECDTTSLQRMRWLSTYEIG